MEISTWRTFEGLAWPGTCQPGDRFVIDPTRPPAPGDIALVDVNDVPDDGLPEGMACQGVATALHTVAGLGPHIDPFWEINREKIQRYWAERCGGAETT